jgi:putative transposase
VIHHGIPGHLSFSEIPITLINW